MTYIPTLPPRPKTKRHKYAAQKVEIDGETFDSKSEARRWSELRLLERAGQIRKLRRQVSFPLAIGDAPILIRSEGYPNGRQAKYTADFVYVENEAEIIEERKGFDTTESRLRRAVFEAQYGVRIRVTRGK